MNYLVEKHGKSMCDSEVFAPVRRWLDQYLLNEDAFADSEAAVADILNDYAHREEAQNPHGLRYLIKVFSPKKPKQSHALSFSESDDNMITRTYSWEAEPSSSASYPVAIFNCLFSTSTSRKKAHFSIEDREVEDGDWKRGFWQNPTWRKPAVAPGEVNEVIRKYREQMARFRGTLPSKRKLTFDELVARDEARLSKARERCKDKRAAVAM